MSTTIVHQDPAMFDSESQFYEYPIKRTNRFSVYSPRYFQKKNKIKFHQKKNFTFLCHVFCSEKSVDDRLCWLCSLRNSLLSVWRNLKV